MKHPPVSSRACSSCTQSVRSAIRDRSVPAKPPVAYVHFGSHQFGALPGTRRARRLATDDQRVAIAVVDIAAQLTCSPPKRSAAHGAMDGDSCRGSAPRGFLPTQVLLTLLEPPSAASGAARLHLHRHEFPRIPRYAPDARHQALRRAASQAAVTPLAGTSSVCRFTTLQAGRLHLGPLTRPARYGWSTAARFGSGIQGLAASRVALRLTPLNGCSQSVQQAVDAKSSGGRHAVSVIQAWPATHSTRP